MKLSEIRSEGCDVQAWADKGYELPKFHLEAVRQKTHDEPTWIHFGAGNIFRVFPAALLQRVLDAGAYDRGVIVAEGFDYEIIDKAYRPYDNMSLLVLLKSDGSIEKRVVASVTESLKADPQFGADWDRLVEIFRKPLSPDGELHHHREGVFRLPCRPGARGGAPAHHGQGHRPAVRALSGGGPAHHGAEHGQLLPQRR